MKILRCTTLGFLSCLGLMSWVVEAQDCYSKVFELSNAPNYPSEATGARSKAEIQSTTHRYMTASHSGSSTYVNFINFQKSGSTYTYGGQSYSSVCSSCRFGCIYLVPGTDYSALGLEKKGMYGYLTTKLMKGNIITQSLSYTSNEYINNQSVYDILLVTGNSLLVGTHLSIWDYTTMTLTKQTTNSASTEFRYIICIDANTCISSDTSTSATVKYLITSSNFLTASDSIGPGTTILAQKAIGNALISSIGLYVMCSSSYCTFFRTSDHSEYTQKLSKLVEGIYSIVAECTVSDCVIGLNHNSSPYQHSFYNITAPASLADPTFVYSMSLLATEKPEYISYMFPGTLTLSYASESTDHKVYFYEKKPCHADCLTCSGPSNTECLTCVTGKMVLQGVGSCVDCTLDGFFVNGGGQCQSCHVNCQTCSTTANNCNSCKPGLYMQNWDNFCSSCPAGNYISGTSCYQCNSNCLTCQTTSTTCTNCNPGAQLFPDNTCGSCTAPGWFVNSTAPEECHQCSASDFCETCTEREDKCLTCTSSKLFYLNNTCGDCLESNFYEDTSGVQNKCLECDSNCKTCETSSTNCLSCNGVDKLSSTNSTCGPCGDGWYSDALPIAKCYPCDATAFCDRCSISASNCTLCTSSKTLYEDNHCGDCTEPDHYLDNSVSPPICRPCLGSNCLTCQGNAYNCLTCDTTYLLIDNSTNSDKVCVSCPSLNYFINGTDCTPCNTNCLACGGTDNNCTNCISGQFVRTDLNNICHPDCPAASGLYATTVNGVKYCKECSTYCMDCTSDTSCQRCDEMHYVSLGACIDCVSPCEKCSGLNTCINCVAGYLLTQNSSCVVGCPTDTYSNGSHCIDCSNNCKECMGSANNCTTCNNGMYLYPNHTCSMCNEVGWYIDATSCKQCDTSCLTCNGEGTQSCLSCKEGFVLTSNNSCESSGRIRLSSKSFKEELLRGYFKFDKILAVKSSPLEKYATVAIFSCDLSTLNSTLAALPVNQDLPAELPSCSRTTSGWNPVGVEVLDATLQVEIKVEKTIKNNHLVVWFKQSSYLRSKLSEVQIFESNYLILEDITVIKSQFDGALESAAAPASASFTTFQTIIMITSFPQAVILIKVLQTVDYYIYIDCEYPSNLGKFVNIITETAMDYVPNPFKSLVKEEGEPVYERFAASGMGVHIFSNIGQVLFIVACLGALKLMFFGVSRLWKGGEKANNALGKEIFFGILEAYHLDIVLSILIYTDQRDRSNENGDFLKYLVILFVSIFSLFIVSMYLFMGYTVSRLTKAYLDDPSVQVKDMKDEDFKFWLEDKNMRGNKFQRHFNLVQLFKDIVFAVLLYALYYRPLILIILLTVIQSIFTVVCVLYPPYTRRRMNIINYICQILYILLDVCFMCLITFETSFTPAVKYFYIGFGMIALVTVLVGVFIISGLYDTYHDIKEKCKKRQKNKVEPVDAKSSMKSSTELRKASFEERSSQRGVYSSKKLTDIWNSNQGQDLKGIVSGSGTPKLEADFEPKMDGSKRRLNSKEVQDGIASPNTENMMSPLDKGNNRRAVLTRKTRKMMVLRKKLPTPTQNWGIVSGSSSPKRIETNSSPNGGGNNFL